MRLWKNLGYTLWISIFLLSVPLLDMRALHNEAVMEIGLSTFDALKTGVGQHLGWKELMQQ